MLYHGSNVGGLHVIKANAKSHVTGECVAYFTEDRCYALVCCRDREENFVTMGIREDGKQHYATVSASISVNTKHEDFKDLNPLIEANKDQIINYILVEIGQYMSTDCQENKEAIEQAVLQKLQAYFGSRFIVKVTIKMLVQ